jgi:ribosomal protein S18 acetylase RimI-like enzyme
MGAEQVSLEREAATLRYLRRLAERCARTMGPEDVPEVVRLHLERFPGKFLSRLGAGFLTQYYLSVVESPVGIALVAEQNGQIRGFVTACLRSGGFYRQLARQRGFRFFPHIVSPLLRDPTLALRFVKSVFQRFQSIGGEDAAELSSLAVRPEDDGLGLGLALVVRSLDCIVERGGKDVVCAVDTSNQALIRAYESLGFVPMREIHRSDKSVLVEMCKHL